MQRCLPMFCRGVAALLCALLAQTTSGWAVAQEDDCTALFAVPPEFGDFELTVDPADPRHNLLLTVNLGEFRGPDDSPKPIFVVRLSGETGRPIARPTLVATNYAGTNWLNGPEFLYDDETGLGILYQGPGGVHAAWRPQGRWHDFVYDLWGDTFIGNPPASPGTAPGRTPATPPFPTRLYLQFSDDAADPCSRKCYGLVTDATTTAFDDAVAALGLRPGGAGTSVPHPHPLAEDIVLFTACDALDIDDCAVYEVAIDGAGGLVETSLARLSQRSPELRDARLEGGLHPITGQLIVYTMATSTLAVWKADTPHRPLARVARFYALPDRPAHLRLVTTSDALILHFIDRDGDDRGSYISRYITQPSAPVWISEVASGAELVYMPVADRLALFYQSMQGRMERCWID